MVANVILTFYVLVAISLWLVSGLIALRVVVCHEKWAGTPDHLLSDRSLGSSIAQIGSGPLYLVWLPVKGVSWLLYGLVRKAVPTLPSYTLREWFAIHYGAEA